MRGMIWDRNDVRVYHYDTNFIINQSLITEVKYPFLKSINDMPINMNNAYKNWQNANTPKWLIFGMQIINPPKNAFHIMGNLLGTSCTCTKRFYRI